jgi:hypothetical protein
MGGQLSVPQVMLSVPDRAKRSEEYIKGNTGCNRFLQKNLLSSPRVTNALKRLYCSAWGPTVLHGSWVVNEVQPQTVFIRSY